jgi:hypothetical protein
MVLLAIMIRVYQIKSMFDTSPSLITGSRAPGSHYEYIWARARQGHGEPAELRDREGARPGWGSARPGRSRRGVHGLLAGAAQEGLVGAAQEGTWGWPARAMATGGERRCLCEGCQGQAARVVRPCVSWHWGGPHGMGRSWGKKRNKSFFLCNEWHWWVITLLQLHEHPLQCSMESMDLTPNIDFCWLHLIVREVLG